MIVKDSNSTYSSPSLQQVIAERIEVTSSWFLTKFIAVTFKINIVKLSIPGHQSVQQTSGARFNCITKARRNKIFKSSDFNGLLALMRPEKRGPCLYLKDHNIERNKVSRVFQLWIALRGLGYMNCVIWIRYVRMWVVLYELYLCGLCDLCYVDCCGYRAVKNGNFSKFFIVVTIL